MTDELTSRDKVTLLANLDARNLDDYDQKFYKAMKEIPPLGPDEIDDRVRRAIFRFITEVVDPASQGDPGRLVMIGFLHGYMVAQQLKRDIRRKD